MKTISPNRSMRPYSRSTRQFKIAAFILLFTCIIGGLVLWRASVSSLLLQVLAPVVRLRDSFSANEDTLLRAQLASTTAALLDRDVLYAENLDLKNRMGRDAGVSTILAGVLLRPPATPYDTLLVDAGKNAGVVVGNVVAAGGTTLIGTVTEVYDTTARVELFSAPGTTFNALLSSGQDTVPVSVRGQGSGSFVAQVPAGTHASVGDSIVLPGVAGGYAGSVSAVESTSGESFETIYLHLPVDIFNLRSVEVWRQSDIKK